MDEEVIQENRRNLLSGYLSTMCALLNLSNNQS